MSLVQRRQQSLLWSILHCYKVILYLCAESVRSIILYLLDPVNVLFDRKHSKNHMGNLVFCRYKISNIKTFKF